MSMCCITSQCRLLSGLVLILLFYTQAFSNVTLAVDERKQSIILKVASSMKQLFEFGEFIQQFSRFFVVLCYIQ